MVKNKKCEKVTDCRSSNVNKPQLISGTKKQKKTTPITRDEHSIMEIRKVRRNVQLCIPKLSLARYWQGYSFFFFLCRNYSYISQNHKVLKGEFVLFYFRLVRCIEVNMVVDEWERMNHENSILVKHQ